jgi:NSS family neurotransmitter:Na+ symporter
MNKNLFSRVGFILAAAGSAVGLGNIWKFPYMTGEFGGGAFVAVYLLTVVFIGLSIMLAEISIGYMGRKNIVGSFEELSSSKSWRYAGFMAFTGLLILTFYSVVIGWIINYIFVSLTALPTNTKEATDAFMGMLQSGVGTQVLFHTVASLLIVFFVSKGIKGGIEKLNLVLMPLLALILVGMFIYATGLDSFAKSWDFMFGFDFSKLSSEAFVSAVGHAFFTLSLGMGAILTYSASLPENSNIGKLSLNVAALDTIIALVAGLMLFTFLYEYGAQPSKGPGLVFISLPAVFYEMGSIGTVFSVLFFVALAFAGLTSAVSILEPSVEYFVQKYNIKRIKSTIYLGLTFYTVGIVALLSNTKQFSASLTFGSKNLFDWLDFVTTSILLPAGGIAIAVFVGFIMPKDKLIQSLKLNQMVFNVWYFMLRFVVPVAMLVVLLNLSGVIKI